MTQIPAGTGRGTECCHVQIFVQRGEPAIVTSGTRAQMALENGRIYCRIALLAECPRSGLFGQGAVAILARLGFDIHFWARRNGLPANC